MNLYDVFQQAVSGVFPTPDGVVELLPKPVGATACIVAFTHHNFVAAEVNEGWLDFMLDANDPGSELSARFITELANQVEARPDSLDVVLAAKGAGLGESSDLQEIGIDNPHRRLQRALAHRSDVRAFATADQDAILVMGRGLAGRMEVGIEVEPAARGKGLGLRLARAAIELAPDDEGVFVQVAPGNVASLRMVLAAGFKPVAAEVLFT